MNEDYSTVETPAVLIDLDRLDRNLKTTAELAKKAGVKLRPHTKTHKSVWIAHQQLRYGASGITVQKLSEAEVMIDGGITDILVTFPIVGKLKLERLSRLLKRANMTISVDDFQVAQGLSDLGEAMKQRIPLYIDVNTGLNRCGREPGEETMRLVKEVARLQGIRVTGLMTHSGHAYGKTSIEDIRAIAIMEAESLVATQRLLNKEGLTIEEISVGSTPTSKFVGEQVGITETRPGAYVFGDGGQISNGVIDEQDCAMYVLATVVSTPRDGTAIIDAGSKTLSSDVNSHRPGYGICKNHPGVYINKLSEEHGIVHVPENTKLAIGERLLFLPNHCCPVTNLHDHLCGVSGGKFERYIPVDARGKVL